MIVYIVVFGDNSEIAGVFANEEKAEAERENLATDYDYTQVFEHEVIE